MINTFRVLCAWGLGCALLMLSVGPVIAGTVVYKGSTRTSSTQIRMPLASGATVATAAAVGSAAMTSTEAENPLLLDMKCSGMGLLADSGASITYYCTFSENDVDQFDVKGVEKPEGSTAEVIGGSGKWAGATGSGTFKRKATSETSSTSTFELTIETP
jgi:hypothetical protein